MKIDLSVIHGIAIIISWELRGHVIAKNIILISLVICIIIVSLRRSNYWIRESSTKIILFYMVMNNTKPTSQALSLNLVRLR